MADNPDLETVIQRLKESRPPATDTFTYLTIVEKSLSPEILPTLHEILQDAELTGDIGWDLVGLLIAVPGSEKCLETIAQLGNPREVMLMIHEILSKLASGDSETEDEEDEEANEDPSTDAADPTLEKQFVALLGMLTILHKRLQVSAPSRFVHATLQTVVRCYNPRSPRMTAAVIDLARSLSGEKRPPLPTRRSSTKLETPFQTSDEARNAPDPEADTTDKADPIEPALVTRLLQSFITCVIDKFVNGNEMEWAARQFEHYNPDRVLKIRRSVTASYKEDPLLSAQDALMGQLAAIAQDLGLSKLPSDRIKEFCRGPILKAPLSKQERFEEPAEVPLSTTGFYCLVAYWMFAANIFGADYADPALAIFPDHFQMMMAFLGGDAQAQIAASPGAMDALLVIGMDLLANKFIGKPAAKTDEGASNFMTYHHFITLAAVFHPSLTGRNAASSFAGKVLHAVPDDRERLLILSDLLENCIFAALQACAVSWLREEILQSRKEQRQDAFSSHDAIDQLEHELFPDMGYLAEEDPDGVLEYWAQTEPFHLQVANFAYFLFAGRDNRALVPDGLRAVLEVRYVSPLTAAAKKLENAVANKQLAVEGAENLLMSLRILVDRLESIPTQSE